MPVDLTNVCMVGREPDQILVVAEATRRLSLAGLLFSKQRRDTLARVQGDDLMEMRQ